MEEIGVADATFFDALFDALNMPEYFSILLARFQICFEYQKYVLVIPLVF